MVDNITTIVKVRSESLAGQCIVFPQSEPAFDYNSCKFSFQINKTCPRLQAAVLIKTTGPLPGVKHPNRGNYGHRIPSPIIVRRSPERKLGVN